MADLSVNGEVRSLGGTDWGAIWAGLFTFVGIWSVFELLGLAIFPAANAGAKVGLGIWSIILTAVAMLLLEGYPVHLLDSVAATMVLGMA